jgi:hypothetical protein
MSSCQPEPWHTYAPESLSFSGLKPLALLEYNKPEPKIA